MIKNRISCRAALLLIGLFCLSMFFPLSVSAAGAVDPSKKAELSLNLQIDNSAQSGLTVKVYRTADISPEADFSLTGQFKGYSVQINDMHSDYEWNAAAQTLAGYAQADGLAPDRTAVTASDGSAAFDGLDTGLYLIVTDPVERDGVKIRFSPFLVSLPSLNEDDEWSYKLNVSPKGEAERPEEKEITMQVVKQWKADGDGNGRPDQIDVVILKDGAFYSEQILSAANDWSYRWTVADDGSSWCAVEKSVPEGYRVSSEREGTSLIVTNTHLTVIPGSPPFTGYDGLMLWPSILLIAGGCLLIAAGLKIRNTKGGRNEG